jgi:hypothetical protein
MDFRQIAIDRIKFDAPSGNKIGIRYGSERCIRVQSPRVKVQLTKHSFGQKLTLVSANECQFSEFLKTVECLGLESHVDIDQHPMETLYVSEDTIVFDKDGIVLDVETLTPGCMYTVSYILRINGLIITRDVDGCIMNARLFVDIDQMKVHEVDSSSTPQPKVFMDGQAIF